MVDLAYTETQRMLMDVTREFIAREIPKHRVREIDDGLEGFSAELWAKMAQIGLPGMAVRESYGGTASSLMDYAMVFEALGEGAVPSPLLSSAFAVYLLDELGAGTPGLFEKIARGDRLVVVALTEVDYGWGVGNLATYAEAVRGGFSLQGTKAFVPYAHVADELLVVANTASGVSVFRVPTTGLEIRRQSGWLGEPVCEVDLAGVTIPRVGLVGEQGAAWPAIERSMDKVAALLCAYMLGGAQRVTDMAIDYSKTRQAFGVPIGTFQRVQDLVVSALNDSDAIRWSTYEALWKLDESRSDASLAVSMAKAIASEAFPRACENAHYVHAGIGMDLDYGLTHHTKRSRFYSLYLGDATHHKQRMAQMLGL